MKPQKISNLEDFFGSPVSIEKEEQKDQKKKDEVKVKSLEEFFGSPNEDSTKPNDNFSNLINETNRAIRNIANEQGKIIDGIKELHSNFVESRKMQPSTELKKFFSSFEYKVGSPFQIQVSTYLDELENGISDEKFVENLKIVAKPRTRHPLKKEFNKYKKLITKEFISSLRKLKSIPASDYAFVSMILSNVNSFVYDVKRLSDESVINNA